jgi:hypothetical protein
MNYDNPYFRGSVMPYVFVGEALLGRLCKNLDKMVVRPWEESPDGI